MAHSIDVLRAVSERANAPENYVIQRESAPAILAAILHRIRIGSGDDVRDTLNRLLPSDMIQTEHIFIVSAAKHLIDGCGSLEIKNLECEIAKHDPAGFVKMVFDGLLESRVPDDFEIENAVDHLVASRALTKKDRSAAAAIARDVLQGRTLLREAAAHLVEIAAFCRDDKRQLFYPFEKFLSEIRDFPLGDARKNWNRAVLAKKDDELCSIEQQTIEDSKPQLQAISAWSPQRKWWQFWN